MSVISKHPEPVTIVDWVSEKRFLSECLVAELRSHLPEILTAQRWDDIDRRLVPAEDFLAQVDEVARMAFTDAQKVAYGSVSRELAKVAASSRRLLNDLRSLHPDSRKEIGPLGGADQGSIELPELEQLLEFLSTEVDAIVDGLPSSPGIRPADEAVRNLTRQVVTVYRQTVGELPPRSKECWFVLFMERLAEGLGWKCGWRIVGDAVAESAE